MTTGYERLRSRFLLIVVLSVTAFVGAVAAIEIAEKYGTLPGVLTRSNLYKYAFSLCVFALTFFLSSVLAWGIPGRRTPEAPRELSGTAYRRLLLTVTLVAGVLLLHRRFFAEVNDYAFPDNAIPLHQIPLWCALPLTAAAALLAVRFSRRGKDISSRWVFPAYFAVILLAGAATLLLDITRGDLFHGTAYLESIYNVLHGVPYTQTTTGIYGHYALFLAPILRLFGSGSLTVMLMMSALICITAAAGIYCIHNLIEENWLRILAAFASCMCLITLRTTNYWQVQPHRMLFPMLTAAFLVRVVKTNCWDWRRLLAGWLLSTAAVLWNTEAGLFCAIAVAAAFLVHDLQTRRWYQPAMFLRYGAHVALIFGSVLAAIGVMNAYNYLCGYRTPEISLFFFPMGVSDYMNGTLRYDITVDNDAWVYVLVLFAVLLLVGLYHTSLFQGARSSSAGGNARYAPLCVAVAILGLLNFSYYANRAAYRNLEIIFQIACVAMCLFWRMFSPAWKDGCSSRTVKNLAKAAASVVCLAVVAVLAMQSVAFAGQTIRRNAEEGHYSTRYLREACEIWQETVPQDTFAFGTGVATVYEELGWDPGGRYRDMSDLNVGGDGLLNTIADDALTHDAFAVLRASTREDAVVERILEQDPSYVLTAEVTFPFAAKEGNCRLLYYTR
ncbi:MAG: hypothetical protein SOW84_08930 [Candidatus Faecousia sp.]|nr:hypothetical protein [Candidatus Faecousia sp.]